MEASNLQVGFGLNPEQDYERKSVFICFGKFYQNNLKSKCEVDMAYESSN